MDGTYRMLCHVDLCRILGSVLATLTLLLCSGSSAVGKGLIAGKVTVDLSEPPLSDFRPDETFGAALDGQEMGEVAKIYTEENIRKMQSAGLRKITYRLRTELGIEAWHWSEQGKWSDAEHQQGYWVSSSSPDQWISVSHGYRLPRRGNTIDQAEDNGYSRLTDGDPASFWKSNPYLDKHYTGEGDETHPQWVVVDFGKIKEIDAAKILWGEPYAKQFEIEYWVSEIPDFAVTDAGEWKNFPGGSISGGDSGPDLIHLSDTPVRTRYVRILLRGSSGTAPIGSTDVRDSLGFAIDELYFGIIDDTGAFQDAIEHSLSNRSQTITYTSSTDPWHRATDLDANTEQPGFDLVFSGGVTRSLPVLMPVGLLYDNPENAAAEIRFLKARGYPIHQVEMGEEPDGQYVSPEHEGALYLEFATTLHAVDPTLALGGPSFQSGIVHSGFDVDPNRSWVTRFLGYLRQHGRLEDYRFLSFEWYPFDDLCQQPSTQLVEQPDRLAEAFREFRRSGISRSMPWIISEYGFSAFAGRTMVEVPSALLNADIVGKFLTLGGKTAYLYGYEPSSPINERRPCAGYGQLMLFEGDQNLKARWPMPAYFAARLITQDWAQPANRWHKLYAANSDIRDGRGRQIVTAYAVKRPDHKLAIMLVNKDAKARYSVRLGAIGSRSRQPFKDRIDVFQYSSQQYAWKSVGEHGHPTRTVPPRHFTLFGNGPVELPPFSLTIVRGETGKPSELRRVNPHLTTATTGRRHVED
jgi:hypothetical protein